MIRLLKSPLKPPEIKLTNGSNAALMSVIADRIFAPVLAKSVPYLFLLQINYYEINSGFIFVVSVVISEIYFENLSQYAILAAFWLPYLTTGQVSGYFELYFYFNILFCSNLTSTNSFITMQLGFPMLSEVLFVR